LVEDCSSGSASWISRRSSRGRVDRNSVEGARSCPTQWSMDTSDLSLRPVHPAEHEQGMRCGAYLTDSRAIGSIPGTTGQRAFQRWTRMNRYTAGAKLSKLRLQARARALPAGMRAGGSPHNCTWSRSSGWVDGNRTAVSCAMMGSCSSRARKAPCFGALAEGRRALDGKRTALSLEVMGLLPSTARKVGGLGAMADAPNRLTVNSSPRVEVEERRAVFMSRRAARACTFIEGGYGRQSKAMQPSTHSQRLGC